MIFLDVEESGLWGWGTLEESGSNLVLTCKAAVVSWLINAHFVDEGDEEEDRDQEEERACVVGEMWKEKDREDGKEGSQELPTTDWSPASHPWLV